ncbi:MAG: tetraacyldisaccharide 4'-kinase [Candidatus Omnitrophota bacterium]
MYTKKGNSDVMNIGRGLIEKNKINYINLVKNYRKGVWTDFFLYILSIFAFLYGFSVKLLLFCYNIGWLKSYKSRCRVISVGNITWGGTGKTPLVEAVAEFFKSQGKRPVILIRGYGRDEACMLQQKLAGIPVLAGKNRVRTAQLAEHKYNADTLILDDGFQHWPLKRDSDIVLVDAHCPFGSRQLIPRGILREPLSALARAEIFVLTKTDFAVSDKALENLKNELRIYNHNAPIYEAAHSPCFLRKIDSEEKIDLGAIKKQKVALLAGIADPLYFQNTLGALEAEISLQFHFADHYQYKVEDIKKIEASCLNARITRVITTEKDAVKLSPILNNTDWKVEFLVLLIKLRIKEEGEFFSFLAGNSQVSRAYSILLLSDGKAGHLNQSAAVARVIKKQKIAQAKGAGSVDLKTVEIKFKKRVFRLLLSLCAIFSGCSGRWAKNCLGFCLQKESFTALMQSRADVVISAGTSLSSVNLFIAGVNQAKKVALMKPPPFLLNRFDLVIAPEHDRIKRKKNVLLTRITPNLIDPEYLKGASERLSRHGKFSAGKRRNGPAIGLLLGGDNADYKMTGALIEKIVSQIKSAAGLLDGELLVTTSRRTPPQIEKFLRSSLAGLDYCRLLVLANQENVPDTIGGILGLSDIVVVSAESVSMLSEAVSAGKHILTFSLEKKNRKITKQERFLDALVRDGMVKSAAPEELAAQIEDIWRNKPEAKIINDKDKIYQAIDRILFAGCTPL